MKYILIAIIVGCLAQYPNTRYTGNDYKQFDSAKYYKSKQIYWEKKYKKESKRLDNLKTPELSQELLDYQDSAIRYKLLLKKYKLNL